jgi:hypothetical protein
MSAEIDQEKSVVELICDICGKTATVPLSQPTEINWRLEGGLWAFCSDQCEADFNVTKKESA